MCRPLSSSGSPAFAFVFLAATLAGCITPRDDPPPPAPPSTETPSPDARPLGTLVPADGPATRSGDEGDGPAPRNPDAGDAAGTCQGSVPTCQGAVRVECVDNQIKTTPCLDPENGRPGCTGAGICRPVCDAGFNLCNNDSACCCAAGAARCAGSGGGREECIAGIFQRRDCNAPPGGVPRCNNGQCAFDCPGLHACNGQCRACCNPDSDCPARGSAIRFCDGAGTCAYRCADGRDLCGNTCCGDMQACQGNTCQLSCASDRAKCENSCVNRFACVALLFLAGNGCRLTTACNVNEDPVDICARDGLRRQLVAREADCSDAVLTRLADEACASIDNGQAAPADTAIGYNFDEYDAAGTLTAAKTIATATCGARRPVRP
jgi:hypothetical protein